MQLRVFNSASLRVQPRRGILIASKRLPYTQFYMLCAMCSKLLGKMRSRRW